jgi:hypothetical protein
MRSHELILETSPTPVVISHSLPLTLDNDFDQRHSESEHHCDDNIVATNETRSVEMKSDATMTDSMKSMCQTGNFDVIVTVLINLYLQTHYQCKLIVPIEQL